MISEQEQARLDELQTLADAEGDRLHPNYKQELEDLKLKKADESTPEIKVEVKDENPDHNPTVSPEVAEEVGNVPEGTGQAPQEIEGGDSNGQEESTGEESSTEGKSESDANEANGEGQNA